MMTYEYPIGARVAYTGAGLPRLARAKVVALEIIQTFSMTARDVLFAYAMTGNAMASLAIITVRLEVLLRRSTFGAKPTFVN